MITIKLVRIFHQKTLSTWIGFAVFRDYFQLTAKKNDSNLLFSGAIFFYALIQFRLSKILPIYPMHTESMQKQKQQQFQFHIWSNQTRILVFFRLKVFCRQRVSLNAWKCPIDRFFFLFFYWMEFSQYFR